VKLISAHVENFKSVKDSTEFPIDPKITCLVGKNESGKTAILQAITKLNPTDGEPGDFDEMEYPRHKLNEYQESGQDARALTTTWTLESDDTAALEAILGPAGRTPKHVTVTKSYSNERQYSLELDEETVVQHLINEHELMEDERAMVASSKTVVDLQAALAKVDDPSQRQKELMEAVRARFDKKSALAVASAIIEGRLPKIAFFSEYHRMPGQVSVTDMRQRLASKSMKSGHKVFLALLSMISRSIEDLEKINQHEKLTADLEGASNRITKDIFRYWSQNRHLRVKFIFEKALPGDPAPFNEGFILRTRIENTRHGVTTSFDQRSAGFVWFFSFLVWFSQVKRQYGDNLIILMDEPGLSLHAKAQADLLRYFEEQLAPKYQVIYTTHSPFMIDPQHLMRARTVEDVYLEPKPGEDPVDEPDLGTKVGSDVLSTDRDTIFPLQAALGYEISQTLFIGEHTLLVEGPSEILYFEWFRQKLKHLKRTWLDRRWTISPSGGIDKVPAFVSLFGGNKLHIAVVTDLAAGQKQKLQKLCESQLLRNGHVLTLDTYAGQAEADVEDLFGRTAYIDLVNQTYGLGKKGMPAKRPADAPERAVKEAETFMGLQPPGMPEFDHFTPAAFLMQQGMEFELNGMDVALDRFEALFAELNKLL
jgi:predicted ATP-dependent endonuclease of OLD family